jgi:uncharacterized protein with ParB-like and HNH nuclease domain
MKFSDIKKLTQNSGYQVNQSWSIIKSILEYYQNKELCPLNLNPEFQRGHVWTETQQIAYVEFKLRGGLGSDRILFNCPGWMKDFRGPFVLVDGKQRLTAVLRFFDNEIKVFGHYYREFEDELPFLQPDFIFCINNLPSMKDVLKWYIEINSGGTPHTEEEIKLVQGLLVNYETK